MGSYSLLSQALTHAEVELGCDNNRQIVPPIGKYSYGSFWTHNWQNKDNPERPNDLTWCFCWSERSACASLSCAQAERSGHS